MLAGNAHGRFVILQAGNIKFDYSSFKLDVNVNSRKIYNCKIVMLVLQTLVSD